MDKRICTLTLRVPEKLKAHIEKHAQKNLRTINDTAIYLMARGLHVEKFSADNYIESRSGFDEIDEI